MARRLSHARLGAPADDVARREPDGEGSSGSAPSRSADAEEVERPRRGRPQRPARPTWPTAPPVAAARSSRHRGHTDRGGGRGRGRGPREALQLPAARASVRPRHPAPRWRRGRGDDRPGVAAAQPDGRRAASGARPRGPARRSAQRRRRPAPRRSARNVTGRPAGTTKPCCQPSTSAGSSSVSPTRACHPRSGSRARSAPRVPGVDGHAAPSTPSTTTGRVELEGEVEEERGGAERRQRQVGDRDPAGLTTRTSCTARGRGPLGPAPDDVEPGPDRSSSSVPLDPFRTVRRRPRRWDQTRTRCPSANPGSWRRSPVRLSRTSAIDALSRYLPGHERPRDRPYREQLAGVGSRGGNQLGLPGPRAAVDDHDVGQTPGLARAGVDVDPGHPTLRPPREREGGGGVAGAEVRPGRPTGRRPRLR